MGVKMQEIILHFITLLMIQIIEKCLRFQVLILIMNKNSVYLLKLQEHLKSRSLTLKKVEVEVGWTHYMLIYYTSKQIPYIYPKHLQVLLQQQMEKQQIWHGVIMLFLRLDLRCKEGLDHQELGKKQRILQLMKRVTKMKIR